MSKRVAVFASGRGTNFEGLAQYSFKDDPDRWTVQLLVTDRPGIGALDRAERLGIESVVASPNDDPDTYPERLLAVLEGNAIEIVVLAGYLKLVPGVVVKRYRNRMLNIHPALLPAFGGKGMYGRRVHEAVLESGARVSGVTVHLVDEVYDQGPILAQWPVPVTADDTPESLAARIHEVEHRLYPACVDHLAWTIAIDADPIPMMLDTVGHFHTEDGLPEINAKPPELTPAAQEFLDLPDDDL